MTRKDYELIASVFALETKDEPQGRALSKMRWLATGIATKLQNDNPLFDRAKFLEACGIQS